MKSPLTAQQKAALTASLVDAGIALMRQNLRRAHPAATDAEIDDLLRSWLGRRADPIPGDVSGPVRVRSASR
jgi:hypothetical protein